MKCLNPYVTNKGEAYGCGRCLPCLVKRRRIWSHRILLESSLHQDNAFVTLSYEDKKLSFVPKTALPTLVPRDVQLFLKRLRKAYSIPLRFFVTGEYGDKSWRPHYHLALFNFPTCRRTRTRRQPGSSRPDWVSCCPQCNLVGNTWGLGDVDLGNLEPHSAQYVAGYVTKKLTGAADARLLGRYPEFARMSLRPGIGHGVLQHVAAQLLQHGLGPGNLDVPSCLRHGKKLMPLGRYLRRKLRVMIGRDEVCPPEVINAIQEEMRSLLPSLPDLSAGSLGAKYRKEIVKNAVIDANMGLRWATENRENLQKRRNL